MPSALLGLGCLFVFAVSQALRDTYFGSVFQSVSFFLVAIMAFGGSTIVFGLWAWCRDRRQVRALIGHVGLFFALNATTAAAWIMIFFALKNLEPAIVSTLYTGIGPTAVLALSALGLAMTKRPDIGRIEFAAHLGVLASLIAIALVAVLGQSGLSGPSVGTRLAAVALAVVGGILIAVGHMIARRLGDLGVGSVALMGLRFPLTLGIAIIAEFALDQNLPRPDAEALPLLAATAFALIVIPSFFLQLGVARTSPLTVNVIRALGPTFVFAAQQFDGRLHFSGGTLACILAFVFFETIASMLRGWQEAQQARG
jgi:drug/metabolite transporter (DMT)-like permease